MAFYLYKRAEDESGEHFERVRNVQLAGRTAIYNMWLKKGKPVKNGWHISQQELIAELTDGKGTPANHRLIIDVDPKSKKSIFLIEVLDIYPYTEGDTGTGFVRWTPMMLRMRDVHYKYFESGISREEKERLQASFSVPLRANNPELDIFEFLYLQGDDNSWNWGPVGNVAAPLLYKDALAYFRQFL